MTKERDLVLFTAVDDELFAELSQLAGQRVVQVALWEDSLADAIEAAATDAASQSQFDLDLYLEDGVYFELYATHCFERTDGEPLSGFDAVARRLTKLVDRGAVLIEIAVDEEDGLVLLLGAAELELYLLVGGWLLEEWDELPEQPSRRS